VSLLIPATPQSTTHKEQDRKPATPRTLEAEKGGSQVQGQTGRHTEEAKKKGKEGGRKEENQVQPGYRKMTSISLHPAGNLEAGLGVWVSN
jgi:hypothetical protein